MIGIGIVLGSIGCGRQAPPSAEETWSVDRSMLRATVGRMATVQDSLLSLPETTAPHARDIRDYWALKQALKNRDTQASVQDTFWTRWDRDPESFLWIELAHVRRRYIQDDRRLADAFHRAAGPDSNTAVARWVNGRRRLVRAEEPLRYMYCIESGSGELSDMQAAWLQLMLGRVDQGLGRPEAAVERMAGLQQRAWDLGGAPFVSSVWHDVSMYCRALGWHDDALFAAGMAADCARRDGNDILLIRANLVRGAAQEARLEFPAAERSYREAERLARRGGYQKWIHDAIQFTGRINRSQGNWRTSVGDLHRALDLALALSDTVSAIHTCLELGYGYRYLGQLDSTRIWMARAEDLNRSGTGLRQDGRIARYKLRQMLQLGQYDRADSLRATMSDDLTEMLAFSMLLEQVQQGLETGHPDVVSRGLAQASAMVPTLARTNSYNPELHLAQLAAVFHARQGDHLQADVQLAYAQAQIDAGATEHARWDQAYRTGEVAELAGDAERAARAFSEALERALQLEASDLAHRSRIRLGHVLLNQKRYRRARELLVGSTEVEEYWPRLSAHLFLGMVENRAGVPRSALDHLEVAGRLLHPDAPRDLTHRLHLEHGRSLATLGRPREALAAYRRLDFDAAADGGSRTDNELIKAFNRPYHLEYAEAVIGLLYDNPELSGETPAVFETLAIAESARWRAEPMGPAPDSADLESLVVPPGSAVAVYFMGESASFAWFGADGDWELHRFAEHEQLTRLVENTLIDMESPRRRVHWEGAGEPARVLLDPVESRWLADRPLYLMASGRLSMLPWSALPWSGSGEEGSSRILDHGPLVYLAGLASLAGIDGRPDDPRQGRLLSLGIDGAESGHRLRHAETEARAVAALWPSGGAELRCGERANWRSVTGNDLKSFDMIHLATHARITQGVPGHSSLRLAGEDERPLTLPEIGELGLDAEFVFLSSCDGARSASGRAGGVNSFVRAFMEAGARSVLASTHAVDDEAARFLAERFYTHWLEGKSKAAALRAAQLELRSTRDAWRHPFYWSHYQLHLAGS